MGDIEEASEAKLPTVTAGTFAESDPGWAERWARQRKAWECWLLTVPGRWWQDNQDVREELKNELLGQLRELGVCFDEDEIGYPTRDPDALKLARCSDCHPISIERCKVCELWPVIDGGSDGG